MVCGDGLKDYGYVSYIFSNFILYILNILCLNISQYNLHTRT